MRVVIDTNVFVSSFFGGIPREVVNLWRDRKVTLCLSDEILEEYVEVLRRMGLKNERELGELLALFGTGFNVRFTSRAPKVRVVAADPDDDKFVGCALALDAEVVITGDKALLATSAYRGVKMMSPRAFLEYRGKRA